jgi:hypothetical protein
MVMDRGLSKKLIKSFRIAEAAPLPLRFFIWKQVCLWFVLPDLEASRGWFFCDSFLEED